MNSKEIKNKISGDIKNRMKELVAIIPEDRTGDDYEELLDLFWLVDDSQKSEYLPYLFDYLIVDEHDEVEGVSEGVFNTITSCLGQVFIPCTLQNLHRYNINSGVFRNIFYGVFNTPKELDFLKDYLRENVNNIDKKALLKVFEDIENDEPLPQHVTIIKELREILNNK